MDNPFAPGAGTPPPELAGRETLRDDIRVALGRIRLGRHAKGVVMVGLRGVGKTVLLDRIRADAEALGVQAIRIEAPEGRSLPALLAPEFRLALLRLSRSERARDLARRGLRALAGFATSLKVTYRDIEVGLDLDPEPGLADNGDLEHDLQALLEIAAEAARAEETALALFIDEMQYVPEPDLAALLTALHRASQRSLPTILVAAGLPQLRGQIGAAKTYAERMFDYPTIGALDDEAARLAIEKPLAAQGASIDADALDLLVANTHGYPYFLQEWGKHTWDAATGRRIDIDAVRSASEGAVAALDENFFKVRFDRLTQAERTYLKGMSQLGPGPHRSGDIAASLQRTVTSLGPVRASLIAKGMIWSPEHGETAFTVPLFDEFMRRAMPLER
jgi:hypothetical protein